MHKFVVFFASLSCSASGRRVHAPRSERPQERRDSARALNKLLLGDAPRAAFNAFSAGVGSSVSNPTPRHSRSVVLDAPDGSRHRVPAMSARSPEVDEVKRDASHQLAAVLTSAALLSQADPAYAATMASGIPGDLVMRGHIFAIFLTFMALVTQQTAIYPRMKEDDFDRATVASMGYGLAVALSLVTGSLLLTTCGKGLEFYVHEPTFWLKLELLSVAASLSLFPNIKIAQRALAKKNGEENVDKMSENLIFQMKENLNGMFMALLFAPIFAALMAHGFVYVPELPWQAGAAPVALTLGGLGYKSVQDALNWKDEIHREKEEEERAARIAKLQSQQGSGVRVVGLA